MKRNARKTIKDIVLSKGKLYVICEVKERSHSYGLKWVYMAQLADLYKLKIGTNELGNELFVFFLSIELLVL